MGGRLRVTRPSSPGPCRGTRTRRRTTSPTLAFLPPTATTLPLATTPTSTRGSASSVRVGRHSILSIGLHAAFPFFIYLLLFGMHRFSYFSAPRAGVVAGSLWRRWIFEPLASRQAGRQPSDFFISRFR